jgi:hypothetical protein
LLGLDLNDHDELRHDPVLAVLAGKLAAKRSDCAPLAGKSTLNRLELSRREPSRYHKVSHDTAAIETLFVDVFVEAHRLILDLDATDDPLHGNQEGRFFHGYYDCHCYLPLYIFCGRHLLAAKLRRSNIDASAGAVEEVTRIVGRIRRRWTEDADPAARRFRLRPRVADGMVRGEPCGLPGAAATPPRPPASGPRLFGLARNERLEQAIKTELMLASLDSLRTGRPAQRFKDFTWSTLEHDHRAVAQADQRGRRAGRDHAGDHVVGCRRLGPGCRVRGGCRTAPNGPPRWWSAAHAHSSGGHGRCRKRGGLWSRPGARLRRGRKGSRRAGQAGRVAPRCATQAAKCAQSAV